MEDRLKFYDSGEKPKKNVDVMKLAIAEVCIMMAFNSIVSDLFQASAT